jgi:adenylylsulfate kinase
MPHIIARAPPLGLQDRDPRRGCSVDTVGESTMRWPAARARRCAGLRYKRSDHEARRSHWFRRIIVEQARALDREGRVTGGVVWMTGLSGAGKSTLSTAIAARLGEQRPVELLDGDDIRTFLSAGLGFSRADRDTNVHRIAYVARLLAKHGVLVFVAAISPYADTRARVRELSAAAGHPFVEVFVHAPLATVIERDVKGLYRRAQAGEIASFTGVSDPYEPPPSPDVEVRTDRESRDDCEARIIDALVARGLVGR